LSACNNHQSSPSINITVAELQLRTIIFEKNSLSVTPRLGTYEEKYNCGFAVADQDFFKSCGIAIKEVLPSSCGIAIADLTKVAHADLWTTRFRRAYLVTFTWHLQSLVVMIQQNFKGTVSRY
jgi:hypothetical protein